MIKFVLVGNKSGKLRICRFFESESQTPRTIIQQDVIKLCLKDQKQEGIVEYEDFTVVYRVYTNLIFIAGITSDENELAVMEVLQNFVETLIKYFEAVSEQVIAFNLDRVHMILDEMVVGGYIAETNRPRILVPMLFMDSAK